MSRVVIRPVGQQGIPGEGVPDGGTTGQILAKASNADYDTEWTDNDPDGVQSVTGDGVGGTAEDVVLTFPTPAEIGAYPDTNPSGFVDASGASAAAPVQSVNGDTGVVVLDAGDVGAIPTSEKGAANGVASLGADGRVVEENKMVFGYRSSFYVSSSCTTKTTSVALTNLNFLYANVVLIHNDTHFDRIVGGYATAGDAGRVLRLGVYRQNADGSVTLVLDAGTVDATITGYQEITIDLTLEKGIYLLCAVSQGGTSAQAGAIRITQGIDSQYIGIESSNFENIRSGLSLSVTVNGALPSSFSQPFGTLLTTPHILLRKS